MITTHAERIAWRCLADARRALGPGWDHVSDDVRWGLVCANILSVVAGQNAIDDVDATDVQLANVARYTVEMWRAASLFRERGWKKKV